MLEKKTPLKVASLASVIAPPDEVELPDGTIASVRPLDALGYELWLAIEANPEENGEKVWDLAQLCLPSLPPEKIKALTPVECSVIVEVAAGRIKEVQALADVMSGNVQAPVTTAEPEAHESSTLSDSSASVSGETAVAS